MSPLSIAMLVLSLLGKLPELIAMAERAFSGKPGSGAAKKELVMGSVATSLEAANLAGANLSEDDKAKVMGVTSKAVDTTVDVLKTANVLQTIYDNPDSDNRVAPQAS